MSNKDEQLIGAIKTEDFLHLLRMFFRTEFEVDEEVPRFYPLPSRNFVRWVENYLQWRRRGMLETTPAYKQVIPYIVLQQPLERMWVSIKHDQPSLEGYGKVFVMRRLDGCDEPALVGKTSMGVGGHLEIEDTLSGNPVDYGARRELTEELEFDGPIPPDPKFLGFILGGSQLVDQVHVGMVYKLTINPRTSCLVRERDVLDGWWQGADLVHKVEGLELWSSALMPHLGFILSR